MGKLQLCTTGVCYLAISQGLGLWSEVSPNRRSLGPCLTPLRTGTIGQALGPPGFLKNIVSEGRWKGHQQKRPVPIQRSDSTWNKLTSIRRPV